jgi:hypothetical protein
MDSPELTILVDKERSRTLKSDVRTAGLFLDVAARNAVDVRCF